MRYMITHLYGIFYLNGSGKCGSIAIEDATPEQIIERIQIIEAHLAKLEAAKLDKNRRQSIKFLDMFIKSTQQEIAELKQLGEGTKDAITQ